MKELGILLKKQLELYTALLDIEKKKIDILVKGDVTELDNIVKQEQSYLMSSANLEKQRAKLLKGTKYEDWAMREILADMENSKETDELKEFFSSLSDVINKLKQVNLNNQKLIKTRLSVIDHLSKKTGLKTSGVVYENTR